MHPFDFGDDVGDRYLTHLRILFFDEPHHLLGYLLYLLVVEYISPRRSHLILIVQDEFHLGADDIGEFRHKDFQLQFLGYSLSVLPIILFLGIIAVDTLLYLAHLVAYHLVGVSTFFQLLILLLVVVSIVQRLVILVVKPCHLPFHLYLFLGQFCILGTQVLVLQPFRFLLVEISRGCILQLSVFIESHHRIDVLHDELVDLFLFHKVGGLHGIKEEIVAQFCGQIGGDNLIDDSFVGTALNRRGARAISIFVTIHVEFHTLQHLASRKEIGTAQAIRRFLPQDNPRESNLQFDGLAFYTTLVLYA